MSGTGTKETDTGSMSGTGIKTSNGPIYWTVPRNGFIARCLMIAALLLWKSTVTLHPACPLEEVRESADGIPIGASGTRYRVGKIENVETSTL